MNKTKDIANQETEKQAWSKNKKNKVFLGLFLGLIIITLLLKIIVTILWDIGYYKGEVHLWYWQNNDIMNIVEKSNWNTSKINGSDWQHELARRAVRHPYFFWTLTQFTWQTTLVVLFITICRFFMYDGRTPKWLRWTHSQKTLSIVTMYDIIVCLVFWSALVKEFSANTNSGDQVMSGLINAATILVHAVIPSIMVIYSLIYLLLFSEASRLRWNFVGYGIIYPSIYILFYIIICLIWNDPYPISNISTSNSFKDMWIAFLSLIGIATGMAIMIYFHNWLLFTFNKKYSYERDFEIAQEKKNKITKLKSKVEQQKELLEHDKTIKNLKKEKLALIKYQLAVQKAEINIQKYESRGKKTQDKYINSTKIKNTRTFTKKTKTADVKLTTKKAHAKKAAAKKTQSKKATNKKIVTKDK